LLNDTYGHDIGDMMLREVARSVNLREGDIVARLGGDEFVLVLVNIGHTEKEAAAAAETVGKKLLALLNQPYHLGNVTHVSGASIGITLFKGDGASADDLLKQADLAMYETACKQLAAWAARPETADLNIAVNVSTRQFQQPEFVEQVISTLRRTGADANRLTLELTESVLVHNVEDDIEKMSALKSEGVNFALDDFGTGYSSLYYLKRLPLDQLKIDRSFVHDVLIDSDYAAIARTIVALAQTLGLKVIAEGIETTEQRVFLAVSGCHYYQGYLFSRPLPLEGLERYIANPGQVSRFVAATA
jgi:EAL domain-containing protein (putative c-di-GMP-specific phosphodiesterase class I)